MEFAESYSKIKAIRMSYCGSNSKVGWSWFEDSRSFLFVMDLYFG